MPNEAVMGIVATFQDQASAGLQATARNVATFSKDFNRGVLAMSRFGQAMTNVLLLTNLLPGSMGKAINQTLILAAATTNAVAALAQLVKLYQLWNVTQKVSIGLQIVLAALSGPKGWLAAGAAIAGAGALTAAAIGIANRAGESGVTANVPGRTSGGTTNITINNGVLMGNDADARRLARQIQGFNREDERLGR